MKTERLRNTPDASGQIVPDENQVFRFGDLRLDTGTRQLTGPHGRRELSELTFSVLLTLIRHAPNVVTLDEFAEEAWERGFVSPENLIQRIKLLRQELGDDGKHPRLIKAVRGRGYRLAAEVHAVGKDARSKDNDTLAGVDRRRTTPSRTNRLLNLILAILVILALATIYLVVDKSVLEPSRIAGLTGERGQEESLVAAVETDSEHSIAVLPFKNLSGDPEQAYFSDGMAEELLNLLSKIPGLRVISRTSSFTFRDENVDIPTIADQLGVNHIIEGSVRKSGERIRITAQLIDAQSDSHLWSQTFDRKMSDVFALQDEISAAIVDGLHSATGLSVQSVPQVAIPRNTEAYDAYLRGKYLMTHRDSASLKGAIEAFEEVVEIDPEYARGHAELVIATALHARYGGLNLKEARTRARPHALRAMNIDPGLAEAHLAMGIIMDNTSQRDEKIAYYQNAIELNPNLAIGHVWLSNFARASGRYKEAFQFSLKAAQLDPLFVPAIGNLYLDLLARDRKIEAKEQLDKLSRLSPNVYYDLLGYLESLDGAWSDGATVSLAGLQTGAWWPANDLLIYLAMMDLEMGTLIGLEAKHLDDDPFSRLDHDAGVSLFYSGKPAEAVAAFEQAPGGHPSEITSREIYAMALAGVEDYAQAAPLLESIWESKPVFSGHYALQTELVLALIAARQESADPEGITQLLAALKDDAEALEEANMVGCDWWGACVYFQHGISAYLTGDRDTGLALIEKAVDGGYFIIPNLAFLEFLYNDPDFAPIMEKQQARQAGEREKFLAIVCQDSPFAEVWQPSKDSCN